MSFSRSGYATVNVIMSVIQSIINAVLMFFVRKLFLNTYGIEIIGYQAVFQNILSFLNMAELGFGIAISVHLYGPIAKNDEKKISIIVGLYRKIYRKIGMAIFGIGLIVIPLLPYIAKTSYSEIGFLASLYSIQLLSTVATYFFADRRALFIAYQKSYIVSIIDIFFICFFTILQLFIIKFELSYYYFYIANVLHVLLVDLFLNYYSSKKYTFLACFPSCTQLLEETKTIIADAKSVFVAKICGFVLNSTDGLIISIIMGSIVTGLYANYSYVFITCQNMIIIGYSKIQSSLGNLIYSTSNKHTIERSILMMTLISHLIASAFCLSMCFLSKPLISLWLGEKYILEIQIPVLFSINVYLYLMLYPMSLLFGALGYFKYDKKIVAMTAILNIVISVVLVKCIGVHGVLIGTTISLLIYWVTRTIIIYRIYFMHTAKQYVKNICLCLFAFALAGVVIMKINRYLIITNWFALLSSFVLYVCLIFMVNLCILFRTGIVKYTFALIKRMFNYIRRK